MKVKLKLDFEPFEKIVKITYPLYRKKVIRDPDNVHRFIYLYEEVIDNKRLSLCIFKDDESYQIRRGWGMASIPPVINKDFYDEKLDYLLGINECYCTKKEFDFIRDKAITLLLWKDYIK